MSLRRVEISPSRRKIFFSRRLAYFFTSSETVGFPDIWHVDYSFGSLGTQWGWTASIFGKQDQLERFSISIVTRDEKMHFVCSFRGEGSVCTGWAGVLLGGDEIIDFAGTQERESKKLADYIARLTGVSIGKPLEEMVEMVTCPTCKHSTTRYQPKCLYCGSALAQR